MKKIFFLLLLFLPYVAKAYDVEINGIYYNLIKKGKVAEVTSGDSKYKDIVVLPSQIEVGNEVYIVEIIGEEAFYACKDLKDVKIPNSVKEIKNSAFAYSSDITNIEIPESVTTIGESVFAGSGINNISLPTNCTRIPNSTYYMCDNLINITIPYHINSVGEHGFASCSNLQTINYENQPSITFESYALSGSGVRRVNIPVEALSLGVAVFRNCSYLEEAIVPPYDLPWYLYMGCKSLTSIEIPKGVRRIGNSAFWGCSNVKTIILSESVEIIEKGVFSECENIENVFCYNKNVTGASMSSFENSYIEYATLHVPYGTKEIYKSNEPWSKFGTIVEMEPEMYKLTYIVDGNEYYTIAVEYGATITPEAEPTKEGYTFSGWSSIPETMPAHDVTITGSFTINKYKLVYMVDGSEYKSYEIEYGATITPEAEPTKEGYTFSGWSNIPETMPAKDVTVTGTFTKGAYKLTYMVDGEVYKTVTYDYGATITPEAEPTKEGYTFSGWSEIPSTMPAHDVTVTGSFTINKYKLVYMVDGAEYKSYEIEYGAKITPEAEPTKEGYTFSGWSTIPETMPAKDVTVTGTFTTNKFKLIYMVDGVEYKSYDIEYGATITPEAEPTKEGYTFSGWSSIPETMPAHDVTITGSFTINKYKLVYMVDGSEYKSYEIEYGATITPEAEPTKEGYTFSGWSNIPETMPAKDVTVTGTFTTNKFKLIYMVDGVEYKSYDVEYGATITPEAEPTKEGYTFSGWSTIPETMPAKDVTITGTFTINKYKLVYMVDGAEYKSYEVEYGAKITPETEPTKEGYTFSGWSSIPETMPAKDVTVTGSFTKGAYKLTYIVDGEVYKTVTYDYGDAITPEPAPTKEGYTFSGWSEIPSTMPAKDVTVTGTFTINKYKLIYMVDGAEYKSYEIEYGAKITPEAEPTKEGYTFSGWSSIPETMPAKDVTVTGTFSKGAYKLTYMVDGAVYKTVTYDFGATITPEPAPTKEGYTFSGWSEIPSTMPAKDVTVTGTFTINKYKLIYMVDGEVYKTVTYVFGATITPEPAPTKEGYTFSGWSEIPATMPAKDVTVTGTFTINKYKLVYMVDGVEYKSFDIEYGAKITPEPAPTKEGYTFSGWSSIPETMPAKDVTVTGSFTKGAYKLTYIVDGEVYKTVTYDYGDAITPEPAPTKEGYTFSGWSEIPSTMPAKDVTVTGTFTINKYKLTYLIDNEVYKTYDVEYGATITPEAAPTKENYLFSGWSDIPQTMPAHDVTVTGSFTYVPPKAYTLTYMVDGEVYKTVSYYEGDAITPVAEPTKEGYTFSGWSEIPSTMPAKDVTVSGTFTINKYKLIYMVDGEEYKSYEIEYGAKITPEAEPTKEGYTFSGWSSIPETMPAKDVTVTGTFSKGVYKLTYMVDGAIYKTVTYDFGATITPEAEPTKEGYTFSGWSDIPSTMPAKDVTVTGTFTINKYKLIYMVDGSEYKSYDIEYGAKITPEPAPTKEGYTFSGWSSIPETMPAKDVTVTGSFTKGAYKLTYMVDGEVYKTISYDYGATITPEAEPTKEGYTFSGWSDIPSTMPAKDVTVTGTFTINKYKLVYMVDGSEYKSYDIEYGAYITPEPEPTKDGYIFSGWSEIPTTMPAHDVEVSGTFTQVEFVIDDVTYEISGEGTVTIKGCDQKGDVTIDATVVINGQTYHVTAIAENAFKDNQSITSVTISDGITTIGDNAFNGCIGLMVINIGKDVQTIGNKAFANVGTASATRTRNEESMFIVNCYTESIPYTASDAFENTPIETGTLYVVDNLKDAYKSTSPWSKFGKIIGFDESTGINAIMNDSGNALIFDMQGNRLDNVRKGVNIIRTRDGKTKKMIVK